MYRAFQHR